MDLSKIITVAGKSGLYRVVAQGRNAIIAESLADGKRQPVPSSMRVSTLEEIHMFTTGDDEPLKNILTKLHETEKGAASLDSKGDEKALWDKLMQVLPTADRERIYPSDVRKLFSWYDQLLKAGEFNKKEDEKKEEGEKHAEGAKAVKAGAGKPKVDTAKKSAPKPSGAAKSAAPRRGGQRGA
jgi:hypothetical protein